MPVLILGNPEVPADSLPVRLLPELRRLFPDIEFRHVDPNEEWSADGTVTVIDSVAGLKEPRVFTSLDEFSAAPRLTAHDFDAYAQLRWLLKLGKIASVTILGLPADLDEKAAVSFITEHLGGTTRKM